VNPPKEILPTVEITAKKIYRNGFLNIFSFRNAKLIKIVYLMAMQLYYVG